MWQRILRTLLDNQLIAHAGISVSKFSSYSGKLGASTAFRRADGEPHLKDARTPWRNERSSQFRREPQNFGKESARPSTPGHVPLAQWLTQRSDNPVMVSRLFKSEANQPASQAPMGYFSADIPVTMSGPPIDQGYKLNVKSKFGDVVELDHRVADNLARLSHSVMTPVQSHTLPILFDGRYDLIASAQTGSGKTIAFLAPVVSRIVGTYPKEAMDALVAEDYRVQFPQCLIMAPTRELVQQIYVEMLKVTYNTFARPVALYGGAGVDLQMREVAWGCHMVVATPGRLLDFLKRGLLRLDQCKYLVLDEADRMLDMGFEPQIREVLESPEFGMPQPVPRNPGIQTATGGGRLTALFSATVPLEVRKLAQDFMRPGKVISLAVGRNVGNETPTVPTEIRQEFVFMPNGSLMDRNQKLVELMADVGKSDRVLIFCQTKREVDQVDSFLYRQFNVASIHGDKSQRERTRAIEMFKSGRANVLVATSVAARGLDIPDVKLVVNHTLPLEIDDYVHRVGRTGRQGKAGRAVTLITADALETGSVARDLVRLLRSCDQQVPDFLAEATARGFTGGKQQGYRRPYMRQFENNARRRPFKQLSNRAATW